MAWVKVTSRFRWQPTPAVVIVFKPDGGPFKDGRYLVRRACADEAIANGSALEVDRPNRSNQ